MNKFRKMLLAVAAGAALLGVSAGAQAGYFLPNGVYVPTCVPGYWAPGIYAPIWVPPVCG